MAPPGPGSGSEQDSGEPYLSDDSEVGRVEEERRQRRRNRFSAQVVFIQESRSRMVIPGHLVHPDAGSAQWSSILESSVVSGFLEPRPGGWMPSRPCETLVARERLPPRKDSIRKEKRASVRVSSALPQVVSYPPEWCRPSYACNPPLACGRKSRRMAKAGGVGSAARCST